MISRVQQGDHTPRFGRQGQRSADGWRMRKDSLQARQGGDKQGRRSGVPWMVIGEWLQGGLSNARPPSGDGTIRYADRYLYQIVRIRAASLQPG